MKILKKIAGKYLIPTTALTIFLGCNNFCNQTYQNFNKEQIITIGEFTGDAIEDKFVMIDGNIYFAEGLGEGKYEFSPQPGRLVVKDIDGDGIEDKIILNESDPHYPDELVFSSKNGFYKVITVK